MQPLQQQQSRINLTDLKTQIVKKLGPDRSKRYFYFLNRLLSQKLSKGEFDKLCLWILGRENLPLHNQLIRSILKNVGHAKIPPLIYEKEAPLKSTLLVAKKSPLPEDGYQLSGYLPTPNSCQNSLIWSNGDVLPMSPRKSRSGIRERRSHDRPSPLGQNGRTDLSFHSTTTPDDGCGKVITENGNSKSYDIQRSMQHRQGLAEQLCKEQEALLQRPTKRPRSKKSPDDTVPVHNKGPVELDVVNGFETMQQGKNSSYARSPLRAPLGIPFCLASIGGARKAMPTSNSNNIAVSSDSGVLFDTETLRRRMEQIVGAQGLEGVSADCANLLNNGLDVYLKRLIRSCVELVGSRSQEPAKPSAHTQQSHGKHINGIKPEYQLQMQNSGGPMDSIQVPRTHCRISLLDFKVAMELNPRQLGEDWPLLLEKICTHECEE